MEFLPFEKYSLDRKTGTGKQGGNRKEVKKLQKKGAVKELKAEGKVKRRISSKAHDSLQKSRSVKQKNKTVKQKGKIIKKEREIVEEKSENGKVIPERHNKENKAIRSSLIKSTPENRLFVNMKKKILNVQDVKDLHPDIISVEVPRRKCSSWCWAVFDSKAKAVKALKVLQRRGDLIVGLGLSESVKKEKREKVLNRVNLKRTMKKALRDTWM